MAKTKKGDFYTTYCHIDAPTKQDNEWGKEHKQRRLIIPTEVDTYPSCDPEKEVFNSLLVKMLAKNDWVARRKLDGENIRIRWDGEQALWNGKTNNFECVESFENYMNETFIEEDFEEKFGHDKEVIIFGEKMGPKTQKNELGLTKEEVVIFDVKINGFWLSAENVREVASYFGCRTCYDFVPKEMEMFMSSKSLLDYIRLVAEGVFSDWEGIVATPIVECQNQRGERVIVKIKNRDYTREEK